MDLKIGILEDGKSSGLIPQEILRKCIHDPETDLPAKVQIEMAERAVSRWVMDPDSFPGYRKIAVYQKGKFE